MTSRRFASLFLISLLFLLNCFSYPSSAVSVSHSDPKKVSLDLYYESLCPSCSNFIVNYLADVFENGLITIIDLKLVPYGNARVRSNGTIICQHGPYECFLNTVEACAINVWPDLNKHFSFIYCVEGLVLKKKYMEWESCFKKLGFDRKPIADCYNGGYGRKIELQYAKETDDLKPPHKYVPWVVVDGKPLYEDYVNYITYVCTDPRYLGSEERVKRALGHMNKRLQSNKWLAGDEFTAADVMTGWCVTTMRMFEPIDLTEYDGILGWVQRFNERDAYKRAMGKSDPDVDLKETSSAKGPAPIEMFAKAMAGKF